MTTHENTNNYFKSTRLSMIYHKESTLQKELLSPVRNTSILFEVDEPLKFS